MPESFESIADDLPVPEIALEEEKPGKTETIDPRATYWLLQVSAGPMRSGRGFAAYGRGFAAVEFGYVGFLGTARGSLRRVPFFR